MPKADLIVAADIMYNEELANQLGERILEILSLQKDYILQNQIIMNDEGSDNIQSNSTPFYPRIIVTGKIAKLLEKNQYNEY